MYRRKLDELITRAETGMHIANQLGELGVNFSVYVNSDDFIYLINSGAKVLKLNDKKDGYYISRLSYKDYVFMTSTKRKING